MCVPCLRRDRRWTGFARFTPYPLLVTTMLSTGIFTISIFLGQQLYDASYASAAPTLRQMIQIIFYHATTPLFSTMYGIYSLILHHQGAIRPWTALSITLLLFVGWIITTTFWTNCDLYLFHAGRMNFCANWPTLRSKSGNWTEGNGQDLTTVLQYVRFGLAVTQVLVLWVVVVCCVAGVRNWRWGIEDGDENDVELMEWKTRRRTVLSMLT